MWYHLNHCVLAPKVKKPVVKGLGDGEESRDQGPDAPMGVPSSADSPNQGNDHSNNTTEFPNTIFDTYQPCLTFLLRKSYFVVIIFIILSPSPTLRRK